MNVRTITLISLIALIFVITVFLSLSRRTAPPADGPRTTIIPTRSIPGATAQSTNQIRQAIQKASGKTTVEERAVFSEWVKELPYQTPDFVAVYDTEFGIALISLRNNQAYTPLKQYLSTQGLLNLYLKGSPLFVVSTRPMDELRTSIRNSLIYEFEEGDEADTWIRKLPIRTNTYVVDYDPNTATIVAQLTVAPEQENAVRAEIVTRLRALGVPLDRYTITYSVNNQ